MYFEGMVDHFFPPELQLNRATTAPDKESLFLDLNLSIFNGFVSSNIYDKRHDFDFERLLSNFIADKMNWFLNSMLD